MRIISDAVEHVFRAGAQLRGKEIFHVEVRLDAARLRVYAEYIVCLPDVRPDFTFDVFQLIQLILRTAIPHDVEAAHHLKGFRVEIEQRTAAIAHHQVLAIVSDAPAFGVVFELAQQLERLAVVDEAAMRFPGELHQPVAHKRQPFAKKVR